MRTLLLLVLSLPGCGVGTGTPLTPGQVDTDAGTQAAVDAGVTDAGAHAAVDAGLAVDGGTASAALPIGTARSISRACTQQNAGAGCRVVSVACPGVADREVELKFTEPAQGVPVRGTIVFGSGGNGVGFLLGQEATGQSVRDHLSAAGFRLIERGWQGAAGWYGDNDQGLKANACRGATLFTWIKENLAVGQSYCATGNSGGSAEVGFALTTYGRAPLFDLVVPTGGPAVTRLDLLCGTDPAWPARCASLVDDRWRCAVDCTLPPTHEVCSLRPMPDAASLRADSVDHLEASHDYGTTPVHFLYGTADCGPNVPSSRTWAEQITSPHTIEIVPDMPHALITTTIGADALTRVLLDECVPR